MPQDIDTVALLVKLLYPPVFQYNAFVRQRLLPVVLEGFNELFEQLFTGVGRCDQSQGERFAFHGYVFAKIKECLLQRARIGFIDIHL